MNHGENASTVSQGNGPAASGPGGDAAAGLPCLSVTTASKEKAGEEKPPLPGPRKKQAEALKNNIEWMGQTFGREHVGFLTLTVGDLDAGGRYRNLQDRKEAQRRFHSLLSNVIAKRYQCGVTVTERHRNGGIHFHLAAVCPSDIHGQMDFAACFPPKDARGKPQYKPDYSIANDAIKREWAFWRRVAKQYGFGRHQLQPIRENGEALGRYLGEYLRKDWENRWPEDKGARCVRYFGHWSKKDKQNRERHKAPPFNNRFGWMTPRALAWRELIKQVVLVLKSKGTTITEQNIKDMLGPRWAWRMAKLFEAVHFVVGDWQPKAVQAAIHEHNLKVQVRWLSGGGDPVRSYWWHVMEITPDHLRPSAALEKQMAELQSAKECEADMRQGLRLLAERKRAQAEQLMLWQEVDALVSASGGQI